MTKFLRYWIWDSRLDVCTWTILTLVQLNTYFRSTATTLSKWPTITKRRYWHEPLPELCLNSVVKKLWSSCLVEYVFLPESTSLRLGDFFQLFLESGKAKFIVYGFRARLCHVLCNLKCIVHIELPARRRSDWAFMLHGYLQQTYQKS